MYFFSYLQLFNLSEKRYDISKLHPKVNTFPLTSIHLDTCVLHVLILEDVLCSCVCFRCWTLAGLIIMLQLWIRSAAYVKPWTHG